MSEPVVVQVRIATSSLAIVEEGIKLAREKQPLGAKLATELADWLFAHQRATLGLFDPSQDAHFRISNAYSRLNVPDKAVGPYEQQWNRLRLYSDKRLLRLSGLPPITRREEMVEWLASCRLVFGID